MIFNNSAITETVHCWFTPSRVCEILLYLYLQIRYVMFDHLNFLQVINMTIPTKLFYVKSILNLNQHCETC